MRPGRLQEAPRRPKTHPRRRKTPARRPKTPPRCDFGGFREPNWNQVGHPRAAQTHVLLSFCSVGRVPKPTNTLLTDSPNNGLVPPSANLDSPIGLSGVAKRKELINYGSFASTLFASTLAPAPSKIHPSDIVVAATATTVAVQSSSPWQPPAPPWQQGATTVAPSASTRWCSCRWLHCSLYRLNSPKSEIVLRDIRSLVVRQAL